MTRFAVVEGLFETVLRSRDFVSSLARTAEVPGVWSSHKTRKLSWAVRPSHSQQQPIFISVNSGAPKASCGIGAPCNVAQHRRPASNSTMTTPSTKIIMSVVSR
jgi:hypothetical protein